MSQTVVVQKRRFSFIGLALIALSLAGCAGIRLISDYDEATDKSLVAIQQKTDDFVEMLIEKSGTEDAALEKHKDFYSEIDAQLRHLEFRVSSIPKNDKTIELVKKIRIVILGEGKCSGEGSSLMDLHCLSANRVHGPSPQSLEIARRNVNQTIGAALSLELAKKQGLENNK